jgi:hypothetical protein
MILDLRVTVLLALVWSLGKREAPPVLARWGKQRWGRLVRVVGMYSIQAHLPTSNSHLFSLGVRKQSRGPLWHGPVPLI